MYTYINRWVNQVMHHPVQNGIVITARYILISDLRDCVCCCFKSKYNILYIVMIGVLCFGVLRKR